MVRGWFKDEQNRLLQSVFNTKIKGGSRSRWEQPVRNDILHKEGTWEWKAPFFWDMTLYHWVIGSQHFMGTARILHHTPVKASKLTWQGSTIMRSLGKTQTHSEA